MWFITVLLVGDLWALLTYGVPREMEILTGAAAVVGICWQTFSAWPGL